MLIRKQNDFYNLLWAMKVICPKCGAVYNVDDSEIPDKGVREEGRDWFLEEF